MTAEELEKINKYTRREFKEEELFTFTVILCDNEIDRDCERFTAESLEQLSKLFVGKTGISDHDPSTDNQTARIYDTEVITDESRTTKAGEPYRYLKASAYMVRTGENTGLIAEIDGGIKKEVSISCSASGKVCSICGADRSITDCSHIRGKYYNGQLCHTKLTNITDAYEWSFVAVPAQVNAGVTKKWNEEAEQKAAEAVQAEADGELRRDIQRLAYFTGGRPAAAAAVIATRSMNTAELIEMKKRYESLSRRTGIEVQLMEEAAEETNTGFTMR